MHFWALYACCLIKNRHYHHHHCHQSRLTYPTLAYDHLHCCRAVSRAPRKFNPLKVPKKLQAALPFKTKPKLEAPRKRKSLEQKRAVVLEPQERKAFALLQQLNAIRCCHGACTQRAKCRQP
jgi:hypothetical protein